MDVTHNFLHLAAAYAIFSPDINYWARRVYMFILIVSFNSSSRNSKKTPGRKKTGYVGATGKLYLHLTIHFSGKY